MAGNDKSEKEILKEILIELKILNQQIANLCRTVEGLADEVRTYVTSQTIGKTRGIDTI